MREIQTKMTFKRKNCRWLPAFEIDRRHELGSMIFSVVGRMTSGILGITLFAATSMPAFGQDDDAFHYNRVLGRGINLGNALEAPQEGAWGVTLEADYFRLIKEAGFNSVRIPIRWSAHASTTAPYDIEMHFFQRVDWAIRNFQSALLGRITPASTSTGSTRCSSPCRTGGSSARFTTTSHAPESISSTGAAAIASTSVAYRSTTPWHAPSLQRSSRRRSQRRWLLLSS